MYTVHRILSRIRHCKLRKDIEEARNNLVEVFEIQLEDTTELGTLKTFLENA